MKKILFIIGLIILKVFNIDAQECNCGESFDWMVSTFEKNDAGFQYIVDKKGVDDYKKFTDKLKDKAKSTTSLIICQKIMTDWLHYFRSGHIGIGIKDAGENVLKLTDSEIRQKYKSEKTINLTEKQLITILEKEQNKNPIEGIWYYKNNSITYTIGIIRNEKSDKKFTALIIHADSVYWLPKQIKAEFTMNDDNKTYTVDFYVRDHSKKNFQIKFYNDSANMFYLIDNYWTRIYPQNTLTLKEELQLSFTNSKIPFVMQLSDKTIYLRIPSFLYYQKKYIDSVLTKNDNLITSTPNLIIDIRNGTGGSDHSFEKIIPYLYTNTIRDVGEQYYATELNAMEYENYAKAFKDTTLINHCNYVAKKMREHLGEFITLTDLKYETKTTGKVFPFPHKVAIICNKNNGSADEGFLYEAKQSSKVKVFGKPTNGCFDFSNMKIIDFPNNKFVLYYSMTKSLLIPDYCIDGVGIQPDYFIDSAIPDEDWVEYTRAILEQ